MFTNPVSPVCFWHDYPRAPKCVPTSGVLQYAQDYDETMPRSDYGASGTENDSTALTGFTGNYKWMDAIFPYVKSEQIFDCPSVESGIGNYKRGDGTKYGSYAANVLYFMNGEAKNFPYRSTFGSTRLGQETKLSEIEDSAQSIAVMERRNLPNSNDNSYGFWIQSAFNAGGAFNVQPGTNVKVETSNGQQYFDPGNFSGRGAIRHLETTNLLFADGHVKSVKPGFLMTQSTTNNSSGQGQFALRYFTIAAD